MPARINANAAAAAQYKAEVDAINRAGGATRPQKAIYDARQRRGLAEANALNRELAQCQQQGQLQKQAPAGPQRQVRPVPGRAAPPQANPTPGYRVPKPYPSSSGVIRDANYAGSRVVDFKQGGTLTYLRLNGRSASGAAAVVTKSMLGKGTSTARTAPYDVTPPGFGGKFDQRGHLLAQRLGGSGSDARNVVALTRKANADMRTVENRVYQRLKSCKTPGARVTYSVSPVFGAGLNRPPTRIIVIARGPCGINEFRNIANV